MANALMDSLKKEAVSKIPGAKIITTLAASYHQDNVFIKNRDNLYNYIKANASDFAGWEDIAARYKIAHKDIPDRKFGPDGAYDPEFARLYSFIVDVAGLYSVTLSNEIRQRIPVYTAAVHDTAGTLELMKNFMMSYPKGYQNTSAIPSMGLGDKSPLTLINKEQAAKTQTNLIPPGTVPQKDQEYREPAPTNDLKNLQAGFSLGNFSMTTMIIIILALIVAFFLFR